MNKTPFIKDFIAFLNSRRRKYEVLERGLFIFDTSSDGTAVNPRPLRPGMVIERTHHVMEGAMRTRGTYPLRPGWVEIWEHNSLTHKDIVTIRMRPWRRLLQKVFRLIMSAKQHLEATQARFSAIR